MLFCFKDIEWEKIAVVITKTKYWNSERSVQCLKQNNFLTCSCTFEQLWFKLEKTLGFENIQEKLQNYIQSRVLSWNRLIKERLKTKVIIHTSVHTLFKSRNIKIFEYVYWIAFELPIVKKELHTVYKIEFEFCRIQNFHLMNSNFSCLSKNRSLEISCEIIGL